MAVRLRQSGKYAKFAAIVFDEFRIGRLMLQI
jgi:hypothetical protein